MKCVVHFSFFFRVEASSGITVTAARFSPVHLFIFFFFPKWGGGVLYCVLNCWTKHFIAR